MLEFSNLGDRIISRNRGLTLFIVILVSYIRLRTFFCLLQLNIVVFKMAGRASIPTKNSSLIAMIADEVCDSRICCL